MKKSGNGNGRKKLESGKRKKLKPSLRERNSRRTVVSNRDQSSKANISASTRPNRRKHPRDLGEKIRNESQNAKGSRILRGSLKRLKNVKHDMSRNARNVYRPIKPANALNTGMIPVAATLEAEVELHHCIPTKGAKARIAAMSATTFNKSGRTTTLNLNRRDSCLVHSLLVRAKSHHSSLLVRSLRVKMKSYHNSLPVHYQPLKSPYPRHYQRRNNHPPPLHHHHQYHLYHHAPSQTLQTTPTQALIHRPPYANRPSPAQHRQQSRHPPLRHPNPTPSRNHPLPNPPLSSLAKWSSIVSASRNGKRGRKPPRPRLRGVPEMAVSIRGMDRGIRVSMGIWEGIVRIRGGRELGLGGGDSLLGRGSRLGDDDCRMVFLDSCL